MSIDGCREALEDIIAYEDRHHRGEAFSASRAREALENASKEIGELRDNTALVALSQAAPNKEDRPHEIMHEKLRTLQRERDEAVAWIRVLGEEVYSRGDRDKSLARVRAVLSAFRDVLDGNQAWWDIKSHTGLTDERCKEIEALWYSLQQNKKDRSCTG